MTGYHVGAVLTALLALVLVDRVGWQAMFVVGGVAGLLTLPVMWARLPESEAFLAARDGAAPARASAVVKGRFLAISLALWVASFMGLLLVYGLNTGCRRSWRSRATRPVTRSGCCSRSTSAPSPACWSPD